MAPTDRKRVAPTDLSEMLQALKIRTRRKKFSLGASCFEWPEAPDCRTPTIHAPHSWREQFLAQAGPEVCLIIMQTCKAGKNFVLGRAPKATFVMDVSLPAENLAAREGTISYHCARRRPLQTSLRLTADYAPQETIAQATYRVQEYLQRGPALPINWLNAMCINKLSISSTLAPLHPALPIFLPSLRSVTTLSIDGPITVPWLPHLLNHLPSLSQITAKSLEVLIESPATERACQWTRLVFTGKKAWIGLRRLAYTPLPSDNRPLRIRVPSDGYICTYGDREGLPQFVMERFSRWEFERVGRGFFLEPYSDVRFQDQPDVLRLTLHQLTTLKLPNPTVILTKWTITAPLLFHISRVTDWKIVIDKTCKWTRSTGTPPTLITHRLPALTGLLIPDVSLTDDLLLLLLVYCRSLTQLSVLDVDLKSSHAHWAVERWETLAVKKTLAMRQFEYLPQPKSRPYAVQTDGDGFVQMLVLRNVTLRGLKAPREMRIKPPSTLTKAYALPTLLRLTAASTLRPRDQPKALIAAFKLATSTKSVLPKYLVLQGFTLTADMEAALVEAAAQWPGLCHSMTDTLCSNQGLSLHAPLPQIIRLELVGMCDTYNVHEARLQALCKGRDGRLWQRRLQHSRPVPPVRPTWTLSVRQIMRLAWHVGGMNRLSLCDCELVFELDGSEQVWLQGLTMRHTRPRPITYHIVPPAPKLSPDRQGIALHASINAINVQPSNSIPKPDVIVLDRWTLYSEVACMLSTLKVSRAVVLGPRVEWPVGHNTVAAQHSQAIGYTLAQAPSHLQWVVHENCRVFNLSNVMLGAGLQYQGPVHVVAKDTSFARRVWRGVTACRTNGAQPARNVRRCAEVPYFAPRVKTAIDLAAERELVTALQRVEREAKTVASVLRAEADIVHLDGLMSEAQRLRAKAYEASKVATKAAQKQSVFRQGTFTATAQQAVVMLPGETEAIAQLWAGVWSVRR